MGNKMPHKGMSVDPFVQSLVTQRAFNRENDPGISGKRLQRERRGIEMKSEGPK